MPTHTVQRDKGRARRECVVCMVMVACRGRPPRRPRWLPATAGPNAASLNNRERAIFSSPWGFGFEGTLTRGSEKQPGAADATAAGTVDGPSCAFGSNAFVCPNGIPRNLDGDFQFGEWSRCFLW